MKKSAGRKERRKRTHENKLAAGRDRAAWNEWMQKHPNDHRKAK